MPLSILKGHTDFISGVLLLDDGRILSWSADTTLRLWSADGETLAVLQGHTKWVNSATVLADGRLMSWSEDGYRLWTNDGQPLGSLADTDGRSLRQQTQQGTVSRWEHNGEQVVHWTAQGTIAALYTADADISAFAPISETRCAIGDGMGRVLVIEAVHG